MAKRHFDQPLRFTAQFLQAGDDRLDHRDLRPIIRSAPDLLEQELLKPLTDAQTRRRIRSLPKKLTRSLAPPADFRGDPIAQEILSTIVTKVKLLRLAKQEHRLSRLATQAR